MSKTKNFPKIIVKQLEPQKKPANITTDKIKKFIKENISKFSSVIYLGWQRREYPLPDGSTKRGLRFIATTAATRKEARKLMKKSNNWSQDIWDLT